MSSTLDKYLVQIQEASVLAGIYACRGQLNAEWPLHSAATRQLIKEHDDSITADPEFLDLYIDYHRATLIEPARTRGYGAESGRTLSDLELLAKLQHFGAATGLLDFSWSPLVALWFACADPEHDGKLFMVNTNDAIRVARLSSDAAAQDLTTVFVDTATPPRTCYWEPTSVGDAAARILRQRSVFVIGRPLVHVGDEAVAEVLVAKDDKEPLLRELETLDLHQESLFLDVHGFAQASRRRRVPNLTPDGHTRRANRFYQQGQYEEAIVQYSQAIELASGVPLPYFLRGNAFVASERNVEALKDYNEAINQIGAFHPSIQSAIYYNRGNSRMELGDCDGAVQDYTEAIKIDADSPYYYYNRGNAYLDLSRYSDALDDYNRVTARSNAGHAAFNKGNVLLAMGLLTEALSSYWDAGKKGCNPDGIHQNVWTIKQILSTFDGLEYETKPSPNLETAGTIGLMFLVREAAMERDLESNRFLVYGRVGNTGNTGGPGLSGGPGFFGKPLSLLRISVQVKDAE